MAKTKEPKWSWMSKHDITPNQWRFLLAYTSLENGFNATQAYMSVPGLTEDYQSAAATASRWLKEPKVKAALSDILDDQLARMQATEDKALIGLARIAFIDPDKFYDDQGRLIPINELPKEARLAIQEFEEEITLKRDNTEDDTRLKKVKLSSRMEALKTLMKYHRDREAIKLEISGPGGGPIRTTNTELSKEELEEELKRRGLPLSMFDGDEDADS